MCFIIIIFFNQEEIMVFMCLLIKNYHHQKRTKTPLSLFYPPPSFFKWNQESPKEILSLRTTFSLLMSQIQISHRLCLQTWIPKGVWYRKGSQQNVEREGRESWGMQAGPGKVASEDRGAPNPPWNVWEAVWAGPWDPGDLRSLGACCTWDLAHIWVFVRICPSYSWFPCSSEQLDLLSAFGQAEQQRVMKVFFVQVWVFLFQLGVQV